MTGEAGRRKVDAPMMGEKFSTEQRITAGLDVIVDCIGNGTYQSHEALNALRRLLFAELQQKDAKIASPNNAGRTYSYDDLNTIIMNLWNKWTKINLNELSYLTIPQASGIDSLTSACGLRDTLKAILMKMKEEREAGAKNRPQQPSPSKKSKPSVLGRFLRPKK